MRAKRLVVLVLLFFVLGCSAVAQDFSNSSLVNQLSVTSGLVFISTQTVPSSGYRIHFGNASGSVGVDYGRQLVSRRFLGLYAELPVAFVIKTTLNYEPGGVPKDFNALFLTPSVRVNFFSGDSVTPWVSAGGGYGRFMESKTLYYYGQNPGPTGTNSGTVQFGGGLDVWFWHRWGARVEVRDFYSGVPDLDVSTGRSRQHNYYVGAGVAHRF